MRGVFTDGLLFILAFHLGLEWWEVVPAIVYGVTMAAFFSKD